MMSETMVVRAADGTFTAWHASTLSALGLVEADLEAAIIAEPGALILGPIGLLFEHAVVFNQRRMQSGSGHTSIPDVIIVTDHGDIVVVEVKRLENPELRGRSVVAQVVDYAATMSSTDEAVLVNRLTSGKASTWDELCATEFSTVRRPAALAECLRRRAADAELHLVIACDVAPTELANWVRAAGRQSALGFDLHVVEVRPVAGEPRGQLVWLPRTTIRTEIIHRTVVTVHKTGGDVSVDIKTDSAEQVEDAVKGGAISGKKKSNALAVLAPVAERLGLSPEALWAELDGIHRRALDEDWSGVQNVLGGTEDGGPYLRGKRPDQGFTEGRFGVNLLHKWYPSVFVGTYLDPYDHKQALLAPDEGGDFALILDVKRDASFDGDAFTADPNFKALRERLGKDARGWDFADHLAQHGANLWHPLHLRRPLAEVFDGTHTAAERYERWMAEARSAVDTLLAGGELALLRQRVGR
jgi:hypothetical protein